MQAARRRRARTGIALVVCAGILVIGGVSTFAWARTRTAPKATPSSSATAGSAHCRSGGDDPRTRCISPGGVGSEHDSRARRARGGAARGFDSRRIGRRRQGRGAVSGRAGRQAGQHRPARSPSTSTSPSRSTTVTASSPRCSSCSSSTTRAAPRSSSATGHRHTSRPSRSSTRPGFEIANHTWDHKTLTKLSDAQVESELLRTQKVISAVTGNQAPYMRPPGGATNSARQGPRGGAGLQAGHVEPFVRGLRTRCNHQEAVRERRHQQRGDQAR